MDLPIDKLTRQLDKAKAKIFMGSNAAYLAPLMVGLDFIWAEDIDTAGINPASLSWNPHWFLTLDVNTAGTILLHELWHIGRLHHVRMGNRDPLLWNYACDIWINNQLKTSGYSFKGIEKCWYAPKYTGWVEEDIYADLKRLQTAVPLTLPLTGTPVDPSKITDLHGDMEPMTEEDIESAVNAVVRASHSAHSAGKPEAMGEGTGNVIKQFLTPIVPWESILYKFFSEFGGEDYNWASGDRRYTDRGFYLPNLEEEEDRLAVLFWFFDVSASVGDSQVTRFTSEMQYIKQTYNPKKIVLIQFDTGIQDVREINDFDEFNDFKIKGRGGTHLACVRDYIMEHRPSAAVVFTDLGCSPMEPIEPPIPLIWIVVNNPTAHVLQGEMAHIRG